MEYNHQLTRLETTARAGIVLKCGPQARLCESLDTVVNLRYPRTCLKMGSVSCRESREKPSSSMSSKTACNNRGSELPKHIMQGEGKGLQGSCVSNALNCHPVAPWVYPCNPSWTNAASAQNQIQWYAASVVVVPGPCSLSISLQTVQTLRWGCIPLWLPAGLGHVLLSGSNGCLFPYSSTSNSLCSGKAILRKFRYRDFIKVVELSVLFLFAVFVNIYSTMEDPLAYLSASLIPY
ncbi:cyclic dof factor 2-like [Pyrus ussuriensis x Pyrus communis]|uniref:Cyclic dof factor 2-like n=1 Tax=Pyrus ussuriensis x Pyrus communis TaxID=2448454 RepID=A0A5N5HUT5_9ROSA|nr:cyclic dof factor 2-like [Pyrus ussuriensis x Pyrus communis]